MSATVWITYRLCRTVWLPFVRVFVYDTMAGDDRIGRFFIYRWTHGKTGRIQGSFRTGWRPS